MIDLEDFEPQIKALGQIKLTVPKGHILQGIIDRTIRAMRNYQRLRDGSWYQREEMCVTIGKYIMACLALITEHQWTIGGECSLDG